MNNVPGPSEKAKGLRYPRNSKLLCLRSSFINRSGSNGGRRRRRATSKVVRISRDISLTADINGPSIPADWSPFRRLPLNELAPSCIMRSLPDLRCSAASAPVRGLACEEKQSPEDCEYFTLKPLYHNLPSCPDLRLGNKSAARSSFKSRLKNSSKEKVCRPLDEQPPESTQSYSSLTLQSDWSDDIQCTEEDDDTLPPYYKILPQMFYRFAGISQYSNSSQLQSRNDFKQLITCLGMEPFLEDFLVWFPKPKLVKTNLGYITFDMFCDLFSCKFAQTILESRWQYETLCSAIMTMKCLEKNKVNRIEFPQFLRLYRGLYGKDQSIEKVSTVFNKYDLDGVGLLTIVNIFNFCSEEDLNLE